MRRWISFQTPRGDRAMSMWFWGANMISRKKALLIFLIVVGCPGIYAIGYRNSLSKIDAFCQEIDGKTKTSDLSKLAKKHDVTLIGDAKEPPKSGVLTIIAASPYTMGEYRCTVVAAIENVVRKTTPHGSTFDFRPVIDIFSIKQAIKQLFFLQVEGGELAVTTEIQECYQRVRALPGSAQDKANICIAQDIAYSYYADSIYRQFSERSKKPQAAIQTPFTRLDAVDRRIHESLSELQLTQQESDDQIARLAQTVQSLMTLAFEIRRVSS